MAGSTSFSLSWMQRSLGGWHREVRTRAAQAQAAAIAMARQAVRHKDSGEQTVVGAVTPRTRPAEVRTTAFVDSDSAEFPGAAAAPTRQQHAQGERQQAANRCEQHDLRA